MKHPLYERCYAYMMGKMATSEQRQFVQHLESCPECTAECDEILADREWAESMFESNRKVWTAGRLARYRRIQQVSILGAACMLILAGLMIPHHTLHSTTHDLTTSRSKVHVRTISRTTHHKADSLELDVRSHFGHMRRDIVGDMSRIKKA